MLHLMFIWQSIEIFFNSIFFNPTKVNTGEWSNMHLSDVVIVVILYMTLYLCLYCLSVTCYYSFFYMVTAITLFAFFTSIILLALYVFRYLYKDISYDMNIQLSYLKNLYLSYLFYPQTTRKKSKKQMNHN